MTKTITDKVISNALPLLTMYIYARAISIKKALFSYVLSFVNEMRNKMKMTSDK